jgi:hypothetical protein
MSESFLHYVWQFQYFAKPDLRITSGEEIVIFHPGVRNSDAGPDFLQARVRLDNIEWSGSVEIHILSSSWYEHHHEQDAAYDNVVLHVVWKDDKPVHRRDGSVLPTLELKGRIDERMINNYKELMNSLAYIPCAPSIHKVSSIVKLSMLDKAVMSRLEGRIALIKQLLERNGQDWEETCYQLLAKNFGFKINSEPLFRVAQSLPLRILLKHADKIVQLEALFFGQAGFLEHEKVTDDYYNILKREYLLLSKKYNLAAGQLTKGQWKFLRLRPANFPTIRMAQISTLIHEQRHIFSKLLSAATVVDLRKIFSVQQSDYWQQHYQFMKISKHEISSLGSESINMIIINTVVPLLVAYGKHTDQQYLIDRAVNMLQQIAPESNAILRHWTTLGIPVQSAFDSQALLELFHQYCMKHRCLDCTIGASMLKPVLS